MFLYPRNAILFIACVLIISACAVSGIERGNFGHFKRSLNTTDYGYQVIPDPTGLAPVSQAEKFEVRPGDCGESTHWSDCANDRERSELSEYGKDNYPGDEYWYGWSVYLPADYPNVFPTKTALGQFHQKNSHPVWMFHHVKAGLVLDDHVFGRSRHDYPLISEAALRGKWHRIEVHAKWSKDPGGFFQVWVNGQQKVNYHGQTMDAQQVYFKYGIYRAFVSRYQRQYNENEVPPQTVYYANVKRGLTREDLQPEQP
ncbi:hypothetical protein VA7868_04422 [Vibrio aerogenes CECT 7868]|uniref:Polysaccharide lyase n=1 Tax=Vibrio aerogenes CECT 7868 TaxID=1216006 RepID=A0A1M6ECA0_9VIBR|nr:polysaccharide lyase [Vibrio aerogenes]SHI82938.1 hypothetical protein VA7868_04422 [Vibrio aerogenes CECT 7868]